MSNTQVVNEPAGAAKDAGIVDMRLEVVVIPVSDVDRAKRFYTSLGWRLDADFVNGEEFRGVQVTPPGSHTSIHFGKGLTALAPGSVQRLFLAVDDLEAARAELRGKGVDVSEPFHYATVGGPKLPGREPNGRSYSSYASFQDPDGNGWLLQEITTRFPGRGVGTDVATLTEILKEAEKRHGGYEPNAPKHHWSGWYAAYVVARQRGKTSDEAALDATRHVEGPASSPAK